MKQKLQVDANGAEQLADRILENPPLQGYLTTSNALQCSIQYSRVIKEAVTGISRVR